MNDILGILEEVAATSKRTEKLAILNKHKENALLSDVVWTTYSLQGEAIEFDWPDAFTGEKCLHTASSLLVHSENDSASDELRARYTAVAASLTERDAEVFKRMVNKDLRCGVGAKSFNKVWPNLIYIHPYQRCTSYSEKAMKKINWPAIAQEKMDGMYMDVIVRFFEETESNEPVVVDAMSRAGNRLDNIVGETLANETFEIAGKMRERHGWSGDVVLSGELLVLSEDKSSFLPREIGNGLINSIVNGDEEVHIDKNRIVFIVWDCHSSDHFYDTPDHLLKHSDLYGTVFSNLTEIVKGYQTVAIVPYWKVQNMDEVKALFVDMHKEGKEGLVLKNTEFFWSDGTSANQIKLKLVVDGEVKVVGINEGENKYAGMVGSLQCESADGIVKVAMAGLSDAQREIFFKNPEKIIGKIVTVRYNGIVERDGVKSLYLPRMVEIRDDKTEADSYEKLLAQLSIPKFV